MLAAVKRVPVETDEEKADADNASAARVYGSVDATGVKTQKMSAEMAELRSLAKYVPSPETVTYKPIITLIP